MEKYMNYFKLKCLFVSLCIISITISFCSLISSISIYYSADQNNLWYFENILRSWITPPISSLQVKTQCNNNEEFINQYWQLTFEGCGYNFPQRCDKLAIEHNSPLIISDIGLIPNKNLTIWKKKKICAKRLDYNYFNMTITDKDKSCNSGFNTCGTIDSFGNKLCLPKGKTCPKTFKELKEDTTSGVSFSNWDSDISPNFQKIKKSDFFKKTYVKSDVEDNILVETHIRRNPLCYSYSTDLRNRTSPPKTFFNHDYEHECSTLEFKYANGTIDLEKDILKNFDQRAKLIDWYNINELYKDNGVFTAFENLDRSKGLSNELEAISKNKLALLFYNNYPGLNISCIKNFNHLAHDEYKDDEKFPFKTKHLKDIQNVQAFLFCEFLAIMFNGVFIIIEIIVFKDNWFRAAENKDQLVELKYILTNYTYLKMAVVFGYFFSVFCTTLVSSIYYYYLSDSIYHITNLFGDRNCVDFMTYELLNVTCKQLIAKRDRYSTPLVFCVFYLIIYIITIFLSSKTLKRFEEVEEILRENKKKKMIENNNNNNEADFYKEKSMLKNEVENDNENDRKFDDNNIN